MSELKEYISQTEGQNNVHISEDAISTVVAMAAVEVDGVAGLSHIGSDIATAKKNLSKAVHVRGVEDKLVIDLSVVVTLGCNIRDVAANIQESVTASVESMVGLPVEAVHVHVSGISI